MNNETSKISEPMAENPLLPAVIVDTKGWVNNWFENMDGEQIIVRKYPYKTSITGNIDKCSCPDCVIDRAGKQMYNAYEVVSGCKYIGSIIPECCLSFSLPYPIEIWDGLKVDVLFKGGRLIIGRANGR